MRTMQPHFRPPAGMEPSSIYDALISHNTWVKLGNGVVVYLYRARVEMYRWLVRTA